MIKNASLNYLFTLLLFCFISVPVFAQYTAAETKLIEKTKAYYDKGKYDKAIATLKKVQIAHFYDNDLWELRCAYEYDRYQVQFYEDIAQILKEAKKQNATFDFGKLKSTEYRSEMITASSTATLVCPRQETASWILHEQFIEPSVDTAISDEAEELYDNAGVEYGNSNFSGAIRGYEKALKVDSNYYNATYKIAMCYFKDEKYEKAIPFFQKAIRLEPEMLDPRQNLVNCHVALQSWQEAYNSCVEGIIAYPDVRFFTKMEAICEKLGKTFNRHWMPRDYMPSMIASTTQSTIPEEPWSFYRQAKDKISEFCNDDGIVRKKIEFTEQKYLECYCWEFMLKKTDTEEKEFGFVRKVQKEGFLDCYTMVSMYHIAFGEQYKDFSKKNADRIRTYINTYLVK